MGFCIGRSQISKAIEVLGLTVYVQVPQLIENYTSGSAEGISLAFLTVWFMGDLSNLLGSIWAELVPTVVALAIYFCFADVVLIAQCLFYRYARSCKNTIKPPIQQQVDSPTQPLLTRSSGDIGLPGSRRRSSASQIRRSSSLATSTLPTIAENEIFNAWVRNLLSVLAVCVIGGAGWATAWRAGVWKPTSESKDPAMMERKLGAEILGYLSAALYLG